MKILHLDLSQSYVPGERIPLPDEEAHHCLRVLRLRSSDRIRVSDGHAWVYSGRLDEDENTQRATVVVDSRETIPAPATRLHLHLSPLSKAASEELLRHAAELGVSDIHWTVMTRSEPHWHYEKVVSRFQKILREAVKSSGRVRLPILHAPVVFDEVRDLLKQGVHLFGALDREHSQTLAQIDLVEFCSNREDGNIHLWIGPEGDFTEDEVKVFAQMGAHPVTLGHATYRAQMAAMIAIVLIQSRLGEL